MNIDMNLIFTVVSIIISILAIVLLRRVFIGPTVIDRLLAADCIDILIGIVMVLYGCIENRAIYLDLGLIVTLLGFIGTVLISKYVEGEV